MSMVHYWLGLHEVCCGIMVWVRKCTIPYILFPVPASSSGSHLIVFFYCKILCNVVNVFPISPSSLAWDQALREIAERGLGWEWRRQNIMQCCEHSSNFSQFLRCLSAISVGAWSQATSSCTHHIQRISRKTPLSLCRGERNWKDYYLPTSNIGRLPKSAGTCKKTFFYCFPGNNLVKPLLSGHLYQAADEGSTVFTPNTTRGPKVWPLLINISCTHTIQSEE